MNILSALTHLLGVVILTYILSYRITNGPSLKASTWPRICILLIFAGSLLFMLSTGILVFGAGHAVSQSMCTLGAWLCMMLYLSTKIFTFIFLRTCLPWSHTVHC